MTTQPHPLAGAAALADARAMIEPLTGYTPGPWRCSRADLASYDAETGAQVSFLYPGDGERVRLETDNPVEDARLSAAAPDLRDMVATLADALEAERAENQRLREALAWYGEQARLARLIHSEGDAGRRNLDADGGSRARVAEVEGDRGWQTVAESNQQMAQSWQARAEAAEAALASARDKTLEEAAQVAERPFAPSDIGGDLICNPHQSEATAAAIRAMKGKP